MKEQKNGAKEAFNGTAFAQFLLGPSRRQAGAVLLASGVSGDDGGSMDPKDEA